MDTTTAKTILSQLGGQGMLQMMVGAHSFLAEEAGVSFKLRGAKKNIKAIKVELKGDDTYTVTFFSPVTKKGVLDIKQTQFSGLHDVQMKSTIESETGLYLSLR